VINAYKTLFGIPESNSNSGVVGVDGKIIETCIFQTRRYEEVGWINLAQDRVQWRAAMNTLMSFYFHKMRETD
jgi:hypothetical protein